VPNGEGYPKIHSTSNNKFFGEFKNIIKSTDEIYNQLFNLIFIDRGEFWLFMKY